MEFEDVEDFLNMEDLLVETDNYDKSPFQIVVAIDFGTSRSGFAYAFFYGNEDEAKTRGKEPTIHKEKAS